MSEQDKTESAEVPPITIELTCPITFGERRIESLTFRPLTAKDLRRVTTPPAQTMAMTLELAGYLSGETSQVIDMLQGVDAMAVIGAVGDFFGDSRGTGTDQ